jgi:hypothetical protein
MLDGRRHIESSKRPLMDLVVKLVILGLVAAAFWWACQPQYQFVIRIEKGEARVVRGKVTAAFLERAKEVCSAHHVHRGWIGGVQRGKRIALHFARSIPHFCQQQLRNQWVLHG